MRKPSRQALLDLPIEDLLTRPVIGGSRLETRSVEVAGDERGAIFTRREVAAFILDLVGYVETESPHLRRALEPAFGQGVFLGLMLERLLTSWRRHGGAVGNAVNELVNAIRAVELDENSFYSTRKWVVNRLVEEGIGYEEANAIAGKWLRNGDFLLEADEERFDFVIGNPPYVRQERIPAALLAEYRARYNTLYDRADIYVPFIERSLSLLAEGGKLGFICTDRWMKNRYGAPLRALVAQGFHLMAYVDMVDTDAFDAKVSAYPAITIIRKAKSNVTRVVHRPRLNGETLTRVANEVRAVNLSEQTMVREVKGIVNGAEPWLWEESDQVKVIRRIEATYPTLEEARCRVGIGVATGADRVFIGDYQRLDVETDRKLPLATTTDIQTGEMHWQGKGVINPFEEDGSLADLNKYPRLRNYLEANREVIANRHCARKAPENWYRTIDRIWPDLARKPKLLIPDIKGDAHIVYESGSYYPHHNLYYVLSAEWDMRALQAVLMSKVTRVFIMNYSTKMRGGYVRFQAQYLRRLRLPHWDDVKEGLRQELAQAALKRDRAACDRGAYALYGLNEAEIAALVGKGE